MLLKIAKEIMNLVVCLIINKTLRNQNKAVIFDLSDANKVTIMTNLLHLDTIFKIIS